MKDYFVYFGTAIGSRSLIGELSYGLVKEPIFPVSLIQGVISVKSLKVALTVLKYLVEKGYDKARIMRLIDLGMPSRIENVDELCVATAIDTWLPPTDFDTQCLWVRPQDEEAALKWFLGKGFTKAKIVEPN